MSVIVSKFGGSSLADAEGFRRVRDIIRSNKSRRYIILSAPGRRSANDEKITDLLVRAHALFHSGNDGGAELSMVRQRFTQIIQKLSLRIDPDELLYGLESDVRHSPDRAASRGEYLCARIFSAYAGIPFVDASALILFDKNGRIQRGEIARAVSAMSEKMPCAVIPGFYGSLPDGSIKTFTRGGSDITGALVAAALKADCYENWTDVDGLMSIDPVVCPDAVCHPTVSYRQMRMLAAAGAQVLHPYCVEPVCESGIPTVLKSTFAPERTGTYISDAVRGWVPCICARQGFRAVNVDCIGHEARWVAEGLSADVYTNGWIALNRSEPGFFGRPAAVISAFGLPVQLQSRVTDKIRPLGELHTEHCSKYLVDAASAANAQQILHDMLISSVTASRIP